MSSAPGARSLSGQAARGAAWLGLVNVLSKGSQILVTLALGAFLTRTEVGTVTIAVVMVNLGQTLQSLGAFDVISRTRHEPRAFAGTVLTLSLAAAATISVLLFTCAGVIAGLVGAPGATWPLRITSLGLPCVAYAGVQVAYMHRMLDFRRRLIPDAGSALAGAAVTVIGAATGAGVWSLVAGMLVTAVLAPLLWRVVGVSIRPRFDREHAAEVLRWSRVVGPAGLLAVLLLNIDYVVVTRALGAEANGLYSYAYRFAFVPYIMVTVSIGGVAFPIYARLVERDGPTAIGAAFGRFVHVMLSATGGLYLLLALLASRIVVIDERWAPSAPVLRVLCLYGVTLGLVQLGYDALRAAGRPGLYLRAIGLHVTLLLVLAVALVHVDGIVGVAWAQVAAALLTLAVVLVLLRRTGAVSRETAASLRRSLLRPLTAAAATAGLALAAQGLGRLPPDNSLLGLVTTGAVLAATYAGALWLVDRSALRELREVMGR